MSKSNGVETDSLKYWLSTGALTIPRPTAWYVALFTIDPTDAGTGNEVDTTVDDTAYARQQENASGFTIAGDSATNQNTLTYPAAVYGTGGVPYNVTHIAIFDALTGGNMLFHGELDSHKEVVTGDEANFAPGDLTITEN